MKRGLILLTAISAVILVLDQWTKRLASAKLSYHEPVEVLGQFVRLTYTRNSGVAFGLGAGLPFPYYVFSIIAVVVILWLFIQGRARTLPRQLALSLILGGALGNLVDRLRSGEVVDFIEVGWNAWHWPVFNVADSAVTVGVVLFALTWFHWGESAPETAAGDDAGAGPLGGTGEPRRAAGSVPGGGAEGPLA